MVEAMVVTWNAMETSFSLSPRHLLVMPLADRFRKAIPCSAHCPARARARCVLPVPGGPVRRMPEVCDCKTRERELRDWMSPAA